LIFLKAGGGGKVFHIIHNIRLYIIFFLLFPILSGCWDSREIEQRATILAIGIDEATEQEQKSETDISHLRGELPLPDKDMMKVTAQIAIPGRIPLGPELTGGAEKPVLVVNVVGHTLEDALHNLQQEIADEVFLGHLRIIVMNERIAKKGTQQFNDFLKRNPEIRRTASLVVSKEPAADYLKIVPKLERVPSLYLADMVDNLTGLGKFPPSFIGLVWSIHSSKGQDPYLPYLSLKENSTIQLNGLAYFSGDKMVGKTSPIEIGVFMAVIGIGKGGYAAFIEVPDTGEVILSRAVNRKTKIKVSLKDGNPHVSIRIRYESEIDEKASPKISLKDSSVLQKIEKEASKEVKNSVQKLIKRTQKSKSDIFGFGEHFRAKFPQYWNEKVRTKEQWEEIYQDLTFEVKVDSNFRRVGMKAE
jgi:spore germination protein KC